MIYLIGGIPGMRKSTIITPCFQAQKPVYHNSTDIIRASTSYLLVSKGINPKEVDISEIPTLGKGEDAPAWLGTVGLIKFLSRNRIEALIEGVAILPEGVRILELEDSSLKIRAAFIGYSKVMEFQPPEWTSELESLVEKAVGKDYLENYVKKRNWVYGNMELYGKNDRDRCERQFKNPTEELSRPNFRYFDLIDYIPPERRNGDIAKLQLEDHFKLALDIRSFLLQNETL